MTNTPATVTPLRRTADNSAAYAPITGHDRSTLAAIIARAEQRLAQQPADHERQAA